MTNRVAVYPGSFDPMTNGHVDIIERSLKICDKLIIAIANNVNKTHLFSLDERKEIIEGLYSGRENIEVDAFDGLLVNYLQKRNVSILVRGLRVASDFEYEFQMANMNRTMHSELETIFLMTGQEHFYISSRFVKEAASHGGDIGKLVPPEVERVLKQKFSHA